MRWLLGAAFARRSDERFVGNLRAATRTVGQALAVAVFLPTAALTRIPGFAGRRGSQFANRCTAAVQAMWGRTSLALMGATIEYSAPRPEGFYLVVANHLSWLDIQVLAYIFPGRFVAKSEVAGWPLLGWMARSGGTIFVVQSRRKDLMRVGTLMRETLEGGTRILLFPEGQASRGARVEKFHSGLLDGAAREGLPCLPVSIEYATPDVPWGAAWTACWWGGMVFWRHMWRLLGLKRVIVRVKWPSAAITCADRKDLTERLRAAVVERFVPIAQSPVPPDLPWPELVEQSADASGGVGRGVD